MTDSCFWRGKRAYLHHQSKCIHDDASIFDSAVLKPVDDHAPNLEGPSRSGYTEKLPSMRTRPLKTSQHFVALGNLLFDGEVQIRKPSPHTPQNIFQPFQTWTLAWKWNLLEHILPNKLHSKVDLILIDNFVNEAPDDGVV